MAAGRLGINDAAPSLISAGHRSLYSCRRCLFRRQRTLIPPARILISGVDILFPHERTLIPPAGIVIPGKRTLIPGMDIGIPRVELEFSGVRRLYFIAIERRLRVSTACLSWAGRRDIRHLAIAGSIEMSALPRATSLSRASEGNTYPPATAGGTDP
jgi:hypothetical protein